MKTELIEKLERAEEGMEIASSNDWNIELTNKEVRLLLQALTSVKSEQEYPIGGYAPGNYTCNCSNCNIEFIGDKRATQCESCAIISVKRESEEEVLKKVQEEVAIQRGWKSWHSVCAKLNDAELYSWFRTYVIPVYTEKLMHSFANEEKKQHAIGFVKYHNLQLLRSDLGYITDRYYNEYLTTLNNNER